MLHWRLLLSIISLSASVISVTNDDFIALEGKIKEFIAENPDRRIPLLVRNTFHDLFLQNKAGYHGCIMQNKDFAENIENAGLSAINDDLKNVIDSNFADTGFSLGDVTAFAGKVAVEAAYPCLNIDFKFNRSPCTENVPITANEAPSAFINSIKGLEGMFDYLDGAITSEDLAILFAGAHGIKGARLAPSGWFGVFATITSGKDFIEKTFSSIWKGTSNGTLFQFFTGDTFDPETSIIRLPSDMIFYPSKVPQGSPRDNTAEAKAIEKTLKGFLDKDRSVFDTKFGEVFSKMLSIGEGNEKYVPNSKSENCPNDITTTSAVTKTSTTTIATSSSTTSAQDVTTTAAAVTTSKTTKTSTTKVKSTSTTIGATDATEISSSSIAEVTSSDSESSSDLVTTTTVSSNECLNGYDDCVLSGSNMLLPYIEMMAAFLLLCAV